MHVKCEYAINIRVKYLTIILYYVPFRYTPKIIVGTMEENGLYMKICPYCFI